MQVIFSMFFVKCISYITSLLYTPPLIYEPLASIVDPSLVLFLRSSPIEKNQLEKEAPWQKINILSFYTKQIALIEIKLSCHLNYLCILYLSFGLFIEWQAYWYWIPNHQLMHCQIQPNPTNSEQVLLNILARPRLAKSLMNSYQVLEIIINFHT